MQQRRRYVDRDMHQFRHARLRNYQPTLCSRPCEGPRDRSGCDWHSLGHALWGCFACGQTHLCAAELSHERERIQWTERDLWFDPCPRHVNAENPDEVRCAISRVDDAFAMGDLADVGTYNEAMHLATRGADYDPDAVGDDASLLSEHYGQTLADAYAGHQYAMTMGKGGVARHRADSTLAQAKTGAHAVDEAARLTAHQRRANRLTRLAAGGGGDGDDDEEEEEAAAVVERRTPKELARHRLSARQRELLDAGFTLRDVTFWETCVFTDEVLKAARCLPAAAAAATAQPKATTAAAPVRRRPPLSPALTAAETAWMTCAYEHRTPIRAGGGGAAQTRPEQVDAILADKEWLDTTYLLLRSILDVPALAASLARFLRRWVALAAWTSPVQTRRDCTPEMVIMALVAGDYLTSGIEKLDGIGNRYWLLRPQPAVATALAEVIVLPIKGDALGAGAGGSKKRKHSARDARDMLLYGDCIDEDVATAKARTSALTNHGRRERQRHEPVQGYIRAASDAAEQRICPTSYTNLMRVKDLLDKAWRAPHHTAPWFMDWFSLE